LTIQVGDRKAQGDWHSINQTKLQLSELKKKRDSISSIKQAQSTAKKDNSISFVKIQEHPIRLDDSMEEYVLVKKSKDHSILAKTPPPNYNTVNLSKLSSTTPLSIKQDPKLSRTKQ